MTRIVKSPHGATTWHTWNCDTVGQIIATGQFWDQQIQPAIDSADVAGTALDLGANIGWFTVYMARRFAKVLAVEAHPGTYALLEQNVVENGVDANTVALEGAAFDRHDLLHLAPGETVGFAIPSETDLDETPGAASIAFAPPGEHLDRLPVSAFPLDPVVTTLQRAPHHWPRVTCIKVDCQGCDLRALHGLRVTIARDRPVVIYEFEGLPSRWHGDALDDYDAFFDALGYDTARIRLDLWDYVARPR